MREDVGKLLREIDPSWERFTLAPLAGDASARQYFRVAVEGAPSSLILMALGETGGAEEYGSLTGEDDELPFVHVQRFMSSLGLPVPRIHAWCPRCRLMILDDLGDETLYDRIQQVGLAASLPLYRKALSHLAMLQIRGARALPDAQQLARQAFTAELFRWEFEHYLEFGIDAEGIRLKPAARARLSAHFDRLSAELAALPRVVVHRDFHSKNLMIVGDDVGIIDFQDALLGPAAYDLVSLLRDAYVTLPEADVTSLIDHYRREVEAAGGAADAGLERAVDLCTLQRSLKAAGRFAYFHHNGGNGRYLCFVPTTLANARRALARQPDLAEVQAILGAHVPELA